MEHAVERDGEAPIDDETLRGYLIDALPAETMARVEKATTRLVGASRAARVGPPGPRGRRPPLAGARSGDARALTCPSRQQLGSLAARRGSTRTWPSTSGSTSRSSPARSARRTSPTSRARPSRRRPPPARGMRGSSTRAGISCPRIARRVRYCGPSRDGASSSPLPYALCFLARRGKHNAQGQSEKTVRNSGPYEGHVRAGSSATIQQLGHALGRLAMAFR